MGCEQRFKELYRKEPEGVSFCPYRICPIGAHVDHQLGKVLGFAINHGVKIAFAKKMNGVIELSSLQFEKRAQFFVGGVSKTKENDWADYLRGATVALGERYNLKYGLSGVIEGTLPIGGLSSSAAVTIAFLSCLCKVNDIVLDDFEKIAIAKSAENDYVGVACGKLDQSCEILSKKDSLLYLDTKTDMYEVIHKNPKMKPFDTVIFFSGVERTLAGSKYNMRTDECRAAAYALLAFEGKEYGKINETYLSDVPYELFLKHKDKLPENWRKRAEHYYSEQERVQKGLEAWKNGDIEEFGRLSFESGKSSIYSYETGSNELKTIYEILTESEGVYGGRFMGAGFKGCSLALVNPEYTKKVIGEVTEKYLAKFPHLKGKFSASICFSEDGAHFE